MTKLTAVILTSVLFTTATILPISVMANEQAVKTQKAEQADKTERKQQMKRKLKKMAKFLQLTAEQKEQVKTIFKQSKEDKLAQKEVLKDYREQVKNLIDSSVFDEKAFTELHSQYQSQFAQAALLKVKTKHAVYQLLTLEQREKLMSMKGRGKSLFH